MLYYIIVSLINFNYPNMTTYGAEIEKPISDIDSQKSHHITQQFFRLIAKQIYCNNIQFSDIEPDTIIGADVENVGHIGLDNAFNLQETSSRVTNSLEELDDVLSNDLKIVQTALSNEGASVINMSIHPLGSTDIKFYKAMVAPKGVYEYISLRGWDHKAGIDAKAQNSPSTGVEPKDAAKAVTTIIGSGPAFIGLFANSPFAEGKVSGYKETRATMWERFMSKSISEGDRNTAKFPNKPFDSLKEYYNWMFGPGTNIHFILIDNSDYKTFGDAAILIDNNPCVLEYLNNEVQEGMRFSTGEHISIIPDLSHLEAMQFAQFTGARIRWKFNHKIINKNLFLEAYNANTLEQLFTDGGTEYVYIEGRDPGANFPDMQLIDIDPNIATSTYLAPSAIQAGLIHNLDEAHQYIRSIPWLKLKLLRESAIKYGLDGIVESLSVKEFSRNIIDIAAKGLTDKEHKYLKYPIYVLETNKNGADRALDLYNSGLPIKKIVQSRHVIIP